MGIADRLIELKRLLDEDLPKVVLDDLWEDGEQDALSKDQLEAAETYFDVAIGAVESLIQQRLELLEKRELSERGTALEKRVNEIGRRVGIALHSDLAYVVIVSSAYSEEPKAIASNLEHSAMLSTIKATEKYLQEKKGKK